MKKNGELLTEAIPHAAQKDILDLLSTGNLFRYSSAEQSPVAELESEFAKLLGVKYALAVSSCTSALFLSIRALSLPPKSRVLVPAFTFAAVPSAIIQADCIPVLCEVGKNYRIDLNDFAEKLGQCDAVVISHMRGHTSNMDEIVRLCRYQRIPLIEDAAHSLGTIWREQKIGTLGNVGCFSFQSYKMVNGGEGGMIATDDEMLIAKAIIMSGAYEHNWKKHPVLSREFETLQNSLPLFNVRLSNLSAAVIRPQLRELDNRIKQGVRNYDLVANILSKCAHLHVPKSLVEEQRAPDSIQFNLIDWNEIEAKKFVELAATHGVQVQIFGLSKDNARAFWNWKFLPENPGQLPKTRAMLMRACDVRLPVSLSIEECTEIANVIVSACEKSKALG